MTDFNIAEISVTHTYYYQPDKYLEYCEENDIEPTQEGFFNFVLPEINADFPISDTHTYKIIRGESW